MELGDNNFYSSPQDSSIIMSLNDALHQNLLSQQQEILVVQQLFGLFSKPNRCTLSEISQSQLLTGSPSILSKRNDMNISLFNVALTAPQSAEVLLALLELHPHVAKEKDVMGYFPLRWAIIQRMDMTFIKALLKANPLAAKEKDATGMTALSMELSTNAPSLELVEALLQAYPQAAADKSDLDGRFPLHQALANMNPLNIDLIRVIISSFRDATKLCDSYGMLPLHIVFQNGFNPQNQQLLYQVVKLLLDAYPDAVKVKGGPDQSLPIHSAVQFPNIDVNIVKLLLDPYPDGLKVFDTSGYFPLHSALIQNFSHIALIKLLIESFPTAVTEKSQLNGKLPLHIGVESLSIATSQTQRHSIYDVRSVSLKDGITLIRLLIEIYPQALKERDQMGWLPLHLAVLKSAPTDLVNCLVKANSKVLREKDPQGKYPLHMALSISSSPLGTIQLLLDEAPDLSCEKENSGAYPLHLAVWFNLPLEVVKVVLNANRIAVKERDPMGQYPLHVAMQRRKSTSGDSVEIIRLLSETFPAALLERDMNGNLPLHLSLMQGSSLEEIESLITKCPQSIREKTIQGILPIQFAQSMAIRKLLSTQETISFQNEVDTLLCIAHVIVTITDSPQQLEEQQMILEACATVHRQGMKGIVKCKDGNGRDIYSIASLAMKQFINDKVCFCGKFERYYLRRNTFINHPSPFIYRSL